MTAETFETALRRSSKESAATEAPYYAEVPKDFAGNLAYRRAVLDELALGGKAVEDIWIMGARDLLWTVNTLCWTYDPRRVDDGQDPVVPFITWDYQDEAFLQLNHAVGRHDLAWEKSRDMGASWMGLTVFWYQWMFYPNRTFLMVSRNQDMVEKTGDRDCLFWKIDFLIENLPPELVPPYDDILLHMENFGTRSTIDGTARTGDIARGGRRTAILIDEFAAFAPLDTGWATIGATAAVTKSRLYNSTHKGTATAFYHVCERTNIAKLRMHWTQHPDKNRGLYTSEDGRFKPLDAEYAYPKDEHGAPCSYAVDLGDKGTFYRPLTLDGKVRSPWYDYESYERLAGKEHLIAGELDINPEGSAFSAFDEAVLKSHKELYAVPPFDTGTLDFDSDGEPQGWTSAEGGRFKLWVNLDVDGNPPDGRYAVASDVSAGSGASNSTHVVYDLRDRAKVLEYANPHLTPTRHAELGVAICVWFGGALHIWDATGSTGQAYTTRVLELGYANVYRRRSDTTFSRKPSDKPGYVFAPNAKGALIEQYAAALGKGSIVNRSHEALDECRQFVYTETGTIEHAKSLGTTDPRGARANHGDVVIGDALAAYLMSDIPQSTTDAPRRIPPNCFAARFQEWEREQADNSRWVRSDCERAWVRE